MIGIVGVFKKSHGLDVMNLKGLACIMFVCAAPLANVLITVARSAALPHPVFSVIGLIAALPTGIVFTCAVFRVPLAHASARTKVVSVNLRWFSPYLVTAKIAVNQHLMPIGLRGATFTTASYGILSSRKSIAFNKKLLAAHRADQRFPRVLMDTLAFWGTKEVFTFCPRNQARLSMDFSSALGALKGYPRLLTGALALKRTIFSLSSRQFFMAFRAVCHWFTSRGNYTLRSSIMRIVAAEQTGRICYGMEISEADCAVILERLAGMGLEPRLLDA